MTNFGENFKTNLRANRLLATLLTLSAVMGFVGNMLSGHELAAVVLLGLYILSTSVLLGVAKW